MRSSFSKIGRFIGLSLNELPPLADFQQRFLDHWLDRYEALGQRLPARADFPPEQFHTLMPNVVVFEVLAPLDFRYRLIGTAVRDIAYNDYTGSLMSDISGKGPDSKVWKIMANVCKKGKPSYQILPYIGPKHSVKYVTALVCPLATDHETIDRIFLVSNFITETGQ